MEEAFLAFALVSSFGDKLSDQDYQVKQINLEHHSYLPFGIDAFTKLMVREPYNRSLIQAVLTETLTISSSAAYANAKPFVVNSKDQEETRKLINSYLHENNATERKGKLLTRAFQLYMSIVPFDANSFEFSKFIFTRAPTLSQTLFGVKLLIDMAPIEDLSLSINKTTLYWLFTNKEVILANLSRVSMALVSETGKFARESNEYKILILVLSKALILINSLVCNVITAREVLTTMEDPEISKEIESLGEYSRIMPDANLAFDTFMSPATDAHLSREVVRLVRSLRELFDQQY